TFSLPRAESCEVVVLDPQGRRVVGSAWTRGEAGPQRLGLPPPPLAPGRYPVAPRTAAGGTRTPPRGGVRLRDSFAGGGRCVLSRREIGQPVFTAAASSWNFASSMPGTTASSSRADEDTVGLPSTGSSVTTAFTFRLRAVKPALPRSADRAMAKQLACAAAIS